MSWVDNLFTGKKKYKKQIFFNFKVLERQSKFLKYLYHHSHLKKNTGFKI